MYINGQLQMECVTLSLKFLSGFASSDQHLITIFGVLYLSTIGKARQGKANLFIEHNSYTRQFKVLYSYIKSEEGK